MQLSQRRGDYFRQQGFKEEEPRIKWIPQMDERRT
jgi:hypothetical protein